MRDFIESLRAKPEHVRRRVAMGTSAGITGVVAAGWLAALFASGGLSLAPAPTPGAISAERFETVAEGTGSAFSQLLGAVGAYKGDASASNITVIDGETSSTLPETAEEDSRTVIPF